MSETFRRILSAVILIPIFIFSFTYPNWFFAQLYFLGIALIYFGLREFYDFSERGSAGRPFRVTGLLFAFLIFSLFYLKMLILQKEASVSLDTLYLTRFFRLDMEPIFLSIFLLFVVSFVLQILTRALDGAIFSVGATMAGVLYLAIPLGHFLLLRVHEHGLYFIYYVSAVTMMTDAGAYFGGRWFGRHPAGLKLSPKKTVEGYITGLVVSVLTTFVLNLIWTQLAGKIVPLGIVENIFLSLFLAVVTVIGDLTESAMKRDAKIKDSSSVIPGHGGILDTVDALLFTIPTIYYYVKIKDMI